MLAAKWLFNGVMAFAAIVMQGVLCAAIVYTYLLRYGDASGFSLEIATLCANSEIIKMFLPGNDIVVIVQSIIFAATIGLVTARVMSVFSFNNNFSYVFLAYIFGRHFFFVSPIFNAALLFILVILIYICFIKKGGMTNEED